jgi:hypothetical protein
MEQVEKELLKSKGWKIGTVSDFLELTREEIIKLFISLSFIPFGFNTFVHLKCCKFMLRFAGVFAV